MKLFPFQEFGWRHVAKQLEKRKAYLLADEMGLGKTAQALKVAEKLRPQTMLIVCPASLVDNWSREILMWSPSLAHRAAIISYHRLVKALAPPHIEELIDFVIVDEAHYMRSPKTKWTEFICGSLYPITRKMLFLSGTPMPNYPIQLWPMLSLIAPEYFGHYWNFAKRYANAHQETIPQKSINGVRQSKKVWNVKGASNLEELQQLMRNKCMLRRTKQQVLSQLPPKIYSTIYLRDVKQPSGLKIDWDNLGLEQLQQLEKQEHVSTARRQLGIAKCATALEYIALVLEETHKVVVFAHHREVMQRLRYGLQNYGVVGISGETPEKERVKAINRFQTDPTARVFLGSIQASGVGITLTAASVVIFVEKDWTPGNNEQAEDRCHRIGQHDSVQVVTLIGGKMDEAVERCLKRKEKYREALKI